MGESRFTFRIGGDAWARVEFLAERGPYMSNTDVLRAGTRELWYNQDDPGIGGYDALEGQTRRVTVRFSEPHRERVEALVAPSGQFATESAVVRAGVLLVWRREMQHGPSTEIRRQFPVAP